MAISAEYIITELFKMLNECERLSVESDNRPLRWVVNGYADVLLRAIRDIRAHGRRGLRSYRSVESVSQIIGTID